MSASLIHIITYLVYAHESYKYGEIYKYRLLLLFLDVGDLPETCYVPIISIFRYRILSWKLSNECVRLWLILGLVSVSIPFSLYNT